MMTKIIGALCQRLPFQIRRNIQVPETVRLVSTLSYKKQVPALVMSELTDKRWSWLLWGGAFLAGVVGLSTQKRVFAENPKFFFGRENELETLTKSFSLDKIVYLRGQAGVGKTQIALEFLKRGKYQKHISIDCTSQATYKRDLAKHFPEISLEKLRCTLATEKNYLLILHSVDNGEMAEEIKSLLEFQVGGHVIITGKYESLAEGFLTLNIFGVETKDGVSIFSKSLSPVHKEIFDKLEAKDKEKLISLLKGSPTLIAIVAKELSRLWSDPREPKELVALIKKTSSLDPEDIHLFMEGVKSSYDNSVEAVRHSFNGRDLPQQMVYDVLYFYAFHFMQDKVMVPSYRDGDLLKNLFVAASKKMNDIEVSKGNVSTSYQSRSYSYEGYGKEAICRAFLDVTEKLEEHGLLIKKEVEGIQYKKMTLFFRWWVINHFYENEFKLLSHNINVRLNETKNELDQKPIRLAREKEKAKWLTSFGCHFYQTFPKNPILFEQLSFLIAVFEWTKKFNLSLEFCSEIINSLSEWKGVKEALKQGSPSFSLPIMQSLSFNQLELLFDQLFQENKGKFDPKILSLIEQLGDDCKGSDVAKAEMLLQWAKKSGSKKAHFTLGWIYYSMAGKEKGKERNELLEMAVIEYSLSIEKIGDHIAYNNRAFCHPDNAIGLNKSISDFKEAVDKDPYNARYRKNLGFYLRKRGDAKRGVIEERVASGLSHIEKVSNKLPKLFSDEYKDLVIKFLSSDKEFEKSDWKDRWVGHTMNDGGILFGEILRYHPLIEVLVLEGCHLTDEGMMAIADSLSHNKALKVLRLEYNSAVKGKGIRALSDALKKHSQIAELSLLKSSGIGADDIIYLIDQAPKQLKKIHLSVTVAITEDSRKNIEERAKSRGVTIEWNR